MKMLSSVILLFLMANSFAGHRGGNGGDAVANHFYEIATRITKTLYVVCVENSNLEVCERKSDLKDLILTEGKVQIISDDQVFADDDKQRDAVNNGKDLIIVSRTRWEEMELSLTRSEKRVRLVLHEYLSILGLENSDDYSLTSVFINSLKEKMFDVNAIAGDYVKSQIDIVTFTSPYFFKDSKSLVLFHGRSDMDYVCKYLTKKSGSISMNATMEKFGFGSGLSSVIYKKNKSRVLQQYNTFGENTLVQITCKL